MPLLIDHIDAIARKKQRDVLFVEFFNVNEGDATADDDDPFDRRFNVDWEAHPGRAEVIAWLDEHHIGWQQCGKVACLHMMIPYLGDLYIDLPYEQSLAEYRALEAFLENLDGTMRLPGVRFCYQPLARAMKNAHHDEPGFWEKWAEGF